MLVTTALVGLVMGSDTMEEAAPEYPVTTEDPIDVDSPGAAHAAAEHSKEPQVTVRNMSGERMLQLPRRGLGGLHDVRVRLARRNPAERFSEQARADGLSEAELEGVINWSIDTRIGVEGQPYVSMLERAKVMQLLDDDAGNLQLTDDIPGADGDDANLTLTMSPAAADQHAGWELCHATYSHEAGTAALRQSDADCARFVNCFTGWDAVMRLRYGRCWDMETAVRDMICENKAATLRALSDQCEQPWAGPTRYVPEYGGVTWITKILLDKGNFYRAVHNGLTPEVLELLIPQGLIVSGPRAAGTESGDGFTILHNAVHHVLEATPASDHALALAHTLLAAGARAADGTQMPDGTVSPSPLDLVNGALAEDERLQNLGLTPPPRHEAVGKLRELLLRYAAEQA